MKNKRVRIFILLTILIVVLPICSCLNQDYRTRIQITNTYDDSILRTSEWATDGTVICTASDKQENPQLCSDGAGGAILTWQDNRSGNWDIYAQRVNTNGAVQWIANGVAICTANNDQWSPQLCSDDAGGAIITWVDYRNGSHYDIYAQRVNATGIVQWPANGIIICNPNNDQDLPQLCSDGAGGAIFTWQEVSGVCEIYAQRVNATGMVQWTANGVAICSAANYRWNPQLCSDDAGGAIVTWEDYRSGSHNDIYAQCVNATGIVQWTANGVAICTAGNDQDLPQLCSDGAGGAILTWQDGRGDWDIYAQRINATGSVQWSANGVAICALGNYQSAPQLCSDGAGGAILSWQDMRSGSYDDIYAQRVNATGIAQWITNGVPICSAAKDQGNLQLCSDNASGAIITWQDFRSGSHNDIYAQRVDPTGLVQWNPNGVAICTAGNDQDLPQLCSDGAGGAIITWWDFRSGSGDIYVRRVDATGNQPSTPPKPFPLLLIIGLCLLIVTIVIIAIIVVYKFKMKTDPKQLISS